MPHPTVGPPIQLDLVDKNTMIYQGGLWVQNFTYFAFPSYGQFILEIQEIPEVGFYSGKVVNGQFLDRITPVNPLDVFVRGDFVVVENILSQWKIVSLASYEDLSDVTRIHMQIKDRPGGVLVKDLDSASGSIEIQPTASVSFKLILGDDETILIPPFRYRYDIFFFYGTVPVYRVQRQFGSIAVAPQITKEP